MFNVHVIYRQTFSILFHAFQEVHKEMGLLPADPVHVSPKGAIAAGLRISYYEALTGKAPCD